jgi:hypothetical protein
MTLQKYFSCERKKKYKEASAKNFIKKINKGASTINQFKMYLCKECGQHHIAHVQTRKEREERLSI